MKFTTSIMALAMAAMAAAAPIARPQDANPNDNVAVSESNNGRVDWKSTDDKNRVVHCTPAIGHEEVPDIELPAGQNVTSYFPIRWIGNCWGVPEGEVNTGTGMLAEFNFNDWQDYTYFDLSAIVVPTDLDNIYVVSPAVGNTPISGCWNNLSTCDNLYTFPDAVQTKVTEQNHLEVYLGPSGAASVAKRDVDARSESVSRAFLEGTASRS